MSSTQREDSPYTTQSPSGFSPPDTSTPAPPAHSVQSREMRRHSHVTNQATEVGETAGQQSQRFSFPVREDSSQVPNDGVGCTRVALNERQEAVPAEEDTDVGPKQPPPSSQLQAAPPNEVSPGDSAFDADSCVAPAPPAVGAGTLVDRNKDLPSILGPRVEWTLKSIGQFNDQPLRTSAIELPPDRYAALHQELSESGDLSPDDLLSALMQDMVMRPTFEAERTTKRSSKAIELLKNKAVALMLARLDVSAEKLVGLQQRLENPKDTPHTNQPFTSAPEVSERKIEILDIAFLQEPQANHDLLYSRLRIQAIVQPSLQHLQAPSTRYSKREQGSRNLHADANVVEFFAEVQKRTFCPRVQPEPGDGGRPDLKDNAAVIQKVVRNAMKKSRKVGHGIAKAATPLRAKFDRISAKFRGGGTGPVRSGTIA